MSQLLTETKGLQTFTELKKTLPAPQCYDDVQDKSDGLKASIKLLLIGQEYKNTVISITINASRGPAIKYELLPEKEG